jgi:glycosyltransferase involved in cell wall biosynthesis
VSDLADLGFDVALWRNYHSEAGKDSGAMFAAWEPVRCSIVMSTYNKADALDLSIQSIKQQDVPFNYEIIVVDDGSSDHTRTVCRRHWVRYAHLDRPFYCNPAKARNIAFKMALGDVLIHQCEVIHHTPNSISLLVERLQAGHLEFATVYNATIAGSDPIQTPPHAPFVAVSKGEMYSGPANQRPFFFLGAAFREDIFAAGGYDEDFVGLGYDDNWLADCLTQGRGLKPRFWGDVIAWHLDHPRPDWVYSSQAEMRKLWERKLAIGQFVSSSGPWSFY